MKLFNLKVERIKLLKELHDKIYVLDALKLEHHDEARIQRNEIQLQGLNERINEYKVQEEHSEQQIHAVIGENGVNVQDERIRKVLEKWKPKMDEINETLRLLSNMADGLPAALASARTGDVSALNETKDLLDTLPR